MPYLKKMIYINNLSFDGRLSFVSSAKGLFLVQSNVHVLLLYIFAVSELCRLLCRNIHIL